MRRRLVLGSMAALVGVVLVLSAATVVAAQGDDGDVGVAAQDPQWVSVHGSACAPANLGQSINFATSWSQHGVRNVNALGSGRNFFVVCPIVMTDDSTAQVGADVAVLLRSVDRDASTRVSCTGYRLVFGSPGFVKTVTAADTNPTTGPGDSVVFLEDLVADSDVNFSGTGESAVVVCALVPQSGIFGVVFDSD